MKTVIYSVGSRGFSPAWVPTAREQAAADFVFFSVGSDSSTVGWRTIRHDLNPEIDIPRQTRYFKALPHKVLPEYELSVYVDSNVKPDISFVRKLSEILGNRKIGIFHRGYKLEKEFEKVWERRYDDLQTLSRQHHEYWKADSSLLQASVYWGGMLVRRHLEPESINFGERWWQNILRYSRRDQLSLPIALREFEINQILTWSEDTPNMYSVVESRTKAHGYTLGDDFSPLLNGAPRSREEFLSLEVVYLKKLFRSRLVRRLLELRPAK